MPRPKLLSVVRARQSVPSRERSGIPPQGQRPGAAERANREKDASVLRVGSSPGPSPAVISIALLVTVFGLLDCSPARADLFDSLDAYPPRWHLDTSDCDARVIDHKNLAGGGLDGGGCESLTFQAGVGSESILVYPIEPVRAFNDLVANVSIMSARKGARIGLRVRFPFVRDPQTRRPVAAIIYGATYEHSGKFQSLGIGNVERELRVKIAKLRSVHGSDANVKNPYIDAIAINAYSGPGTTTLRIDQVSVRGMIPVGDHGRVELVPSSRDTRTVDLRDAVAADAAPRFRTRTIRSERRRVGVSTGQCDSYPGTSW